MSMYPPANRPTRDGGNAASRGAFLIGTAVVLGIVLLQVVDNTPSSGTASSSPTTATTSTPSGSSGSTATTKKSSTTTTAVGGRPHDQVTIQVLNGSGISGNAQTRTDTLKGLGYKTVTPGDAARQAGNTLACKAGFETEQFFLGLELKNKGITFTAVAFPTADKAPSAAKISDIDCLLVLGT